MGRLLKLWSVVYINNSVGSGFISDEVLGFNPMSNESYSISQRGKNDFKILLDDNKLKVVVTELEFFKKVGSSREADLILDSEYYPSLLVKFIQ